MDWSAHYIVTMRDEDGTWYLEHVCCNTMQPSSSLSMERSDAHVYLVEAYAAKVAEIMNARWKQRDDWAAGKFKVRKVHQGCTTATS